MNIALPRAKSCWPPADLLTRWVTRCTLVTLVTGMSKIEFEVKCITYCDGCPVHHRLMALSLSIAGRKCRCMFFGVWFPQSYWSPIEHCGHCGCRWWYSPGKSVGYFELQKETHTHSVCRVTSLREEGSQRILSLQPAVQKAQGRKLNSILPLLSVSFSFTRRVSLFMLSLLPLAEIKLAPFCICKASSH